MSLAGWAAGALILLGLGGAAVYYAPKLWEKAKDALFGAVGSIGSGANTILKKGATAVVGNAPANWAFGGPLSYLNFKLGPTGKTLKEQSEAIDTEAEKQRIVEQQEQQAVEAAQKENLLREAADKAAAEGRSSRREGNAVIPQASDLDQEATTRNYIEWASRNANPGGG